MVGGLGEAKNVLDKRTSFGRARRWRSDLSAGVVGEEANVRVHGGVKRADLSTTNKSSKMVGREEPGARRDAFSLRVSEADRSVEFSSEISLEFIVPGNIDVLNDERGQLEPDFVLSAPEDA